MTETQVTTLKVEANVNAPIEKVWKAWNTPDDIRQWNTADPSWHCPHSENDPCVGGKFKHRMEAKDGSFCFYFEGIYDKVELQQEIAYTMSDGRKAKTLFDDHKGTTHMETTFEVESDHDAAFQKQGWQAILNNFVKYMESKIDHQ